MTFQILRSKLSIPVTQTKRLARQHLLNLLDEVAVYRSILVSASAGYGKTAVISEWARSKKEQVAWISLDESDDDPIRFVEYLQEALKPWLPQFEITHDLLSSYPSVSVNTSLINILNSLAENDQQIFLVLDDYHTITDPVIHELLVLLIDHAPADMHVIISTRTDPPIPLDRLRIKNQLWEIRQKELAFSTEEVSRFLNRIMGLSLSNKDSAMLAERTEGWISGVYVAGIYLESCEDKSQLISAFSGNHGYIMDYMVKEVFYLQPKNIRDFLLQSSVLDLLSFPLCNAVTGRNDSKELLEQLVAHNHFIVQLDDKQQWYRYHRLYSDVLRKLLQEKFPDQILELYHRASEWHEEHHFLDDAIEYAFRSKDTNRIINLIERHAITALHDGARNTIRMWLDKLPEPSIDKHPLLNIMHAWALMNDRTAVSDKLLQQRLNNAEKQLEELDGSGEPKIWGNITLSQARNLVTLFKAIFSFERGKPSAVFIKKLKKSLVQIENTNYELSSATLYLMARIQLRTVDLDAAYSTLDDALSIARKQDFLFLVVFNTYLKAWLLYQKGKFHQAYKVCQDTMDWIVSTGQTTKQRTLFPNALQIIQGAIYLEWNQLDKADHCLKSALKSLRHSTESGMIINGMIQHIFVKLALREDEGKIKAMITQLELAGTFYKGAISLASAIQVVFSSQIGDRSLNLKDTSRLRPVLEFNPNYFDQELTYYQEYDWELTERLLIIGLYLTQFHQEGKKPEEQLIDDLVQYLEYQLKGLEQWDLKRLMISVLITLVKVYEIVDEEEKGIAYLGQAIEIAASEGAIREFIENRSLLGRPLRKMVSSGRYIDFIGRILAENLIEKEISSTSPELEEFSQMLLVDPLSSRELEVLRLISIGLSNRKIAGELYISTNTVKYHISRLYDKLNARNRTLAISKAKELGIL